MSNTQSKDIIDINLSAIKKKRIRIDGDDNRILELNTSDMNIVRRLDEVYPKLLELAKDVSANIPEQEDGKEPDAETLDALSNTIDRIDTNMRELMDYLFDSNVSEMCAPFGSMYDPINGQLRFEYIIDSLTALYESNLNKEYTKMKARMDKHTKKYVKK